MKRLDEIEARANAATEGPWKAGGLIPGEPDRIEASDCGVLAYDVAFQVSDDSGNDNAEFISHARTDVPALVAVARFVLSQHSKDETYNECGHCADSYGEDGWPCSTVREIHRLLGEDA